MTVTFDRPMKPADMNTGSIHMYTSGPDGILGNADDTRVPIMINYQTGGNRLVIRAREFAANANYRVILFAKRMQSLDGKELDGEWTNSARLDANNPTGDGVGGGNFEFQVKRRPSNTTVRVSTNVGTMLVQVSSDPALTTTVNNFLWYANQGLYDGTIFHRSGRTETFPIDIIQGGGFRSTDAFDHIHTRPPIPLQSGVMSNQRGTISMARTSQPNSATSQFFFNVQDNPFLDATVPGLNGYAAFGRVTSGLGLVDTIYNAPTVASGDFSNVPQINGQNIVVRRIALLTKIVPIKTT